MGIEMNLKAPSVDFVLKGMSLSQRQTLDVRLRIVKGVNERPTGTSKASAYRKLSNSEGLHKRTIERHYTVATEKARQ